LRHSQCLTGGQASPRARGADAPDTTTAANNDGVPARPRSRRRQLAAILLSVLPAYGALAADLPPDYLSDHPELILCSTQDWGVLGFNAAAHLPDKEASPLQIGATRFAKGLGHHAHGAITPGTDGQYAEIRRPKSRGAGLDRFT
jgi:hypothetical protein